MFRALKHGKASSLVWCAFAYLLWTSITRTIIYKGNTFAKVITIRTEEKELGDLSNVSHYDSHSDSTTVPLLQTYTLSIPSAPSVLSVDYNYDDPLLKEDVDGHEHGDPPPDSDSNKFIITKKFIHRDLPFNASSGIYNDPATTCGRERTRIVLKPFKDPGIFDFHTTVQTNLNILFVGSSIGVQFFTSFEKSANIVKSEVIRYGQGIRYRSNTQISLTPNGGTVGVLRVTGMFSMKNKDERQKMAPSAGGGWLTHDVRELRRMVNEWRPLESINSGFETATSPCEVEVEVEVKNSNVTHSLNSTNSASTASSNSNATSKDKIIYSCEEKSFDIVVHQIAVSFYEIPFVLKTVMELVAYLFLKELLY